MVEIRMQGPAVGADLGAVSVTRDGSTQSVSVGAFRMPGGPVSGDAVTLVFGQSNAGFFNGSGVMENAVSALGGSASNLVVAAGGTTATLPNGRWNIVDGNSDPQTGNLYTQLIADVTEYLSNNPNSYIASAVWVHGEADAQTTAHRDDYATNVSAIFEQARTDLGVLFPITITSISDFQNLLPGGLISIRTQMQQIAATLPSVYYIDTNAIAAANNLTDRDDVLRVGDNLHFNDGFLALMAREILAEPAIRARYNLAVEHAPTVLPLIAGPQLDGEIVTADTSMLSGVTSVQWRVVGGVDLGTAVTQDLTGLGGQRVELKVIHDGGVTVSPPLLVHAPMMMASHNQLDAALVGMVPHNSATAIARQSGNWSEAATWGGGAGPAEGDVVLIPHGVSVQYDVDAPTVLIRQVRVDGELRFATNQSTHLYVRDLVGDRMSAINIGNSLTDRIHPDVQAVVTFEGQSSLDLSSDPELLGRGLITLGALNVFGKDMLNHSRAAFPETAGSTSIVLEKAPVGWGVGHQIIVGATDTILPEGVGIGMADVAQDEIVTITGVVGNTVSFTPALVHDHNNQNPRTDRKDIRPMVQLSAQSRNVLIKSEVTTPVSQRGHIMVMHHHSRTDIWDCGLIELGRTDKSVAMGQIDTDGSFRYHDGATAGFENGQIQNEPLTATSNVKGRYALHCHMVGYSHKMAGRPQPTLVNVSAKGSPGWGIVHHDCEMDIRSCSTFRVFGCGFVAEQGGELGVWHDLSAMQSTAVNVGDAVWLSDSPKGRQGSHGLAGDYFNYGYGFGYRSRAIKMTQCVATTCTYGTVFFHRGYGQPSQRLFADSRLPRSRTDLKEAGQFRASSIYPVDEWDTIDYPIIHFTDCGAIACLSAFFVTKQNSKQKHDFNVILKSPFAHGCRLTGMFLEYIGTYIVQNADIVMGSSGSLGVVLGANTYQVALVSPRIEGAIYGGIAIRGDSVEADTDAFDAATDPRHFVVGYERGLNGSDFEYNFGATKTLDELVLVEDDFDYTYVDYNLNPSVTFPDVLGTWDGTTNANITSAPDNTTGMKFGNHPVGLPVAPKLWNDTIFPAGAGQIQNMVNLRGFGQYNGSDVLVQREMFSDVLSGRPSKFVGFWEADQPSQFGVDNGPVVLAPAVTTTDEVFTVAPNGSVTFNALAGTVGGTGSFEIDNGDHVETDFGDLDIDYGTGLVTYTPHPGVSDQTDYGYLFVRSVRNTGNTQTETRTYGTKRVSFLITNDATLLAPVNLSDYQYGPSSDDLAFEVQLLQRPQSGGRRIITTQYSTDSGVTWRRLCNGYPLTTMRVYFASDGVTPLANGVQNVRLRYATNHENGFSPETPDIPAVVGAS